MLLFAGISLVGKPLPVSSPGMGLANSFVVIRYNCRRLRQAEHEADTFLFRRCLVLGRTATS